MWKILISIHGEIMRTLAIGDIHGCYKALKQVLERSKFDYENDKLICLGDVCDGWIDVRKCFDELLKIKNLVYVLGNHDDWALDWYLDDLRTPLTRPDYMWTSQGGNGTLASYDFGEMDKEHLELLKNAKLYHIENNKLFVHGGIVEIARLESMHKDVFIWDRDMFNKAVMVHPINPDYKFQEWDRIFIGHTTVKYVNRDFYWKKNLKWLDPKSPILFKPLRVCNVWNLDTGAGFSGKLTIMDIDTEEYWQSDFANTLYPKGKGRN